MVTGFFIFLASKAIQILYRLCIRQKISALALSLFTFLCYNKENTGVPIISTTVTNDR